MNKVLVDARWIMPPRTGVGNYCYLLLEEAVKLHSEMYVILNHGCPDDFVQDKSKIIRTNFRIDNHPATEWFEQAVIPYLCWKNKFKAFISFEGRIPIFSLGFKTFSYIYDVTVFTVLGSHNFKYTSFMLFNMVISRFFADRIITISESVKSQVVKLLLCRESKILVIYPSDSGLKDTLPTKPTLVESHNYFLSVGVTNKRKNLNQLLLAFAEISKKHPGIKLVLTGHQDFIYSLLKNSNSENVINLGFVSDEELKYLYQNAIGMVYPSLEEGFGIPLLDAIQNNCAVIASDIPIFREVLGKGDWYFPLNDWKVLLQKMDEYLMNNKSTLPNITRFSWKNSAEKFLELFY